MHVVHIYKDYPPVIGGIENHLKLLAEGQARRGLRVSVLVTSRDRRSAEEEVNGVQVIRASRLAEVASTPLSLALIARLRSLRRSESRPDIVHLHFPYPWGEMAQWISRCGRATVITYHSDIVRQRWLGWLYRPLMHRLLASAERILPTSEATLRSSPILAHHAAKSTVVPLGIDTGRFASATPQRVAEIQQRWPGPRVLFVGRLRYYKGIDDLITAMADVDATLLIVGSGPMAECWQRQAGASPAGSRIHFLGDVDDADLPAFYTAADTFVLPACQRSEAYGLCQVEAMAAATPVVSTELGTGTSYVNRHGETGWVVPPRDAQALAAALNEILGDDERRQAMGRRARAHAFQELGADLMIDRVIAVYRDALAGSRRSEEELPLNVSPPSRSPHKVQSRRDSSP